MSDNIIPFPVPHRVPPFIGAWAPFMIVVEAADIEALPIRGRATDDGPQIEFCPKFIDLDDIAESSIANFWLPPCVVQIAAAAITEGLRSYDGIGRFTSPRWTAFRTAVHEEMGMDWNETLKAARREGVDFMADNIAANLIIESGIAETVASAYAQLSEYVVSRGGSRRNSETLAEFDVFTASTIAVSRCGLTASAVRDTAARVFGCGFGGGHFRLLSGA